MMLLVVHIVLQGVVEYDSAISAIDKKGSRNVCMQSAGQITPENCQVSRRIHAKLMQNGLN